MLLAFGQIPLTVSVCVVHFLSYPERLLQESLGFRGGTLGMSVSASEAVPVSAISLAGVSVNCRVPGSLYPGFCRQQY